MSGMNSSKFPPAIRQASHVVHSLSFVHQSVHKSFCTSILLRYLGDRIANSNVHPLEQIIICGRFYSPPKSDIQPCTDAWGCIFTIWRNWQVATNAVLFACKGIVQVIEVKSLRKMIKYLYLWYDSAGKDFISVWISSQAHLACTVVGGKEHWGCLPLAQPGQTAEDEPGIVKSGSPLVCCLACLTTSFEGWLSRR